MSTLLGRTCYGSVILSGAKSSVIMSCMNKTVALNPQEQKRINVLNEHLRGDLSIAQVAALLKCSQRHIYRLKASMRVVTSIICEICWKNARRFRFREPVCDGSCKKKGYWWSSRPSGPSIACGGHAIGRK